MEIDDRARFTDASAGTRVQSDRMMAAGPDLCDNSYKTIRAIRDRDADYSRGGVRERGTETRAGARVDAGRHMRRAERRDGGPGLSRGRRHCVCGAYFRETQPLQAVPGLGT